jgi:hypothetical protein
MENEINISDAGTAPTEEASVPVANTTGVIPAGETVVETADPLGVQQPIVNEGMPDHSTTIVEEESSTVEAEPTEEAPAKEDPSRHEYWQSQHDKVASENLALKQQIEATRDLQELGQFIQKNPQVLDNIESLSNGPQQGQPQEQGHQVDPLKKPTRPQKPHSYNEVDAFNDPESESFKYRVQKDQYQDSMLDYYENVEQARAIQYHQQQEAQLIQQQQQGAYSYAQNNLGMNANEAREFVMWAENPNNITLDTLGQLFRLGKAPNQQQVEVENKLREMKEQETRLQAPRTTTVQPGKSAPTLSPEDSFNQGLLKNRR